LFFQFSIHACASSALVADLVGLAGALATVFAGVLDTVVVFVAAVDTDG
jgi:hypothetical protein